MISHKYSYVVMTITTAPKPALALPSLFISARPGVSDCIGFRLHIVANLIGVQPVRDGGAIVRTHEEFYEADFFICNALDDPWVQK